uniref:Uncharacterized protein n=1 Tax=viral metagenome TaxID=1070528 RepID=A0A6C0HTQ3_9ZZZZ
MDEFDFYEIKKWGFPDWVDGEFPFLTNLFIDLSRNPHFMSVNILYANFEALDGIFASWFHVNKKTLFLRKKLLEKYRGEILYNHRTELAYFHLTRGTDIWFDEVWKYRSVVADICSKRPMSEITFPKEDLNWYLLASNPHKCVIEFLKKNRENINWPALSENSSDAAVDLLLEEEENIIWWNASSNTNEKIMVHFENRRDLSKIRLSKNPTDMAVKFLLTGSYEIYWFEFCKNPNDNAVNKIIEIVTENRNDARIDWSCLCNNQNPRVLDILRNNKDKIDWPIFIANPICFSYNYEMMRERCLPLKEEIEEMFLRPENVMAIIERERLDSEEDFDVISRLNAKN